MVFNSYTPNTPLPGAMPPPATKVLPAAYDPARSDESAKDLVRLLYPEWKREEIAFVRFTDGITNILLKCINTSHPNPDSTAILLRAYGSKTDVLIDREAECTNHTQLSAYNLAPPLLARFQNGLLYTYVPGKVTSVEEMGSPEISAAVARRLGEWHAVLPVKVEAEAGTLWGVMRRWVEALPGGPGKSEKKAELARELDWVMKELKGVGMDVGYVLGHCDLLSGNVVILPRGKTEGREGWEVGVNGLVPNGATNGVNGSMRPSAPVHNVEVHFIDYEYATPCPRAFDLANHFAEYGGFACDYSLLPSPARRRAFIETYLNSFHNNRRTTPFPSDEAIAEETARLEKDVDDFRGMPGFYWGVWALVQAEISQIDFDYAEYAEVRLKEYWDWKKARVEGKMEGVREVAWAGK